jgi:NADPH:quinone reductase-like Zn-dependent oxidoreductase
MRALVRDRFGPPEVLEVRDVPRPVPTERQVLVRVCACSLNDWDWELLHAPTTPLGRTRRFFVPILGSDIAGIVEAAGSAIRRFKPGDEVHGDLSGFGGWGGFAEFVCVSERRLTLKPPRMTFEQAAALPQAGQLAVQALAAAGPLKPRQKILINGAGGGVGTIGVQLAKSQARDIEVTGVDRAIKLDMMRRIGFDHVIDYTKEDFTKNGRQYDLIVDTKTTRRPSDHLRALEPGGTYATVGGPSIPQLLQIPLVGWWFRLTTGKSVLLLMLKANRDLVYMNEQFEAGKLTPVIDGPYDLDDALEAFRHFGAGNHQGKVVITISPGSI